MFTSLYNVSFLCVAVFDFLRLSMPTLKAPVANLGPSASLEGTHNQDKNVYSFLGIPYATPPVGVLRFQSPQTLKMWSGKRLATQYGKYMVLQL